MQNNLLYTLALEFMKVPLQLIWQFSWYSVEPYLGFRKTKVQIGFQWHFLIVLM